MMSERENSLTVCRSCFEGDSRYPHFVKTIEDYLQHAEECGQLAARARSPAEREMLLNMVDTWEELARSRQTMLASKSRLLYK